ncbi:hypothetical protein F1559_001801 [Cyanidiococcus yangmingshanensis]|uniref:CCAAT-binding factor domain-containing protein n=1 Tax=Cyanidiococcus yangmingshanensis TaxID=2690220 RepID=A0A7J7IHE4_9RHOD|nr:hypothetical protein F1559_001801 [Cyanidiococcus yangmingshanensis]
MVGVAAATAASLDATLQTKPRRGQRVAVPQNGSRERSIPRKGTQTALFIKSKRRMDESSASESSTTCEAGASTGVIAVDDPTLRQDIMSEMRKLGLDRSAPKSKAGDSSTAPGKKVEGEGVLLAQGEPSLAPHINSAATLRKVDRLNASSWMRKEQQERDFCATKSTRRESSQALPIPEKDLFCDDDFREERWYRCIPPTMPQKRSMSNAATNVTLDKEREEQLLELGRLALEVVSRVYQARTQRRGARKSEQESPKQSSLPHLVAQHATLMDRIANLALSIQKSPLHHSSELNELVDVAAGACKKRRRERWTAIEALKEAFVQDLLPPDRKLIDFHQRDWSTWYAQFGSKLDKPSATERPQCREALRVLMYAAFESALKLAYTRFLVDVLADSVQDPIEYLATRALGASLDLLVACPEQEQALLSLLVNTLGSPYRAVSSKAYHCLELLIQKHHPAMRLVVAREVLQLGMQQLPGLNSDKSLRPLYLSTRFLAHVALHDDREADRSFARALLSFYLGMFRALLEKRSFDSRLCTAVLEGIQRILPVIQYSDSSRDDSDNLNRSLTAQIDALYLLVHRGNLETTIRALMVLSRLGTSDRFYRALYETLTVDKLWYATGTKVTAFCNICYLSMKADPCVPRLMAFVKRLLMLSLHTPAATAAGLLLLLSELIFHTGSEAFRLQAQERLERLREWRSCNGPAAMELTNATAIDTSLETWSGSFDEPQRSPKRQVEASPSAPHSSLPTGRHHSNQDAAVYDALKREPKYANAEKADWWELVLLGRHHHSTVVAFANALLQAKAIVYRGDPLLDHSGAAFLARLVRKKPKPQAPIGKVRSVFANIESQSETALLTNSKTRSHGVALETRPGVARDLDQALEDTDTAPSSSVRRSGSESVHTWDGLSPHSTSRARVLARTVTAKRPVSTDRHIVAGFSNGDQENEDAIWAAMEDSLAQQGVLLPDTDTDDDTNDTDEALMDDQGGTHEYVSDTGLKEEVANRSSRRRNKAFGSQTTGRDRGTRTVRRAPNLKTATPSETLP